MRAGDERLLQLQAVQIFTDNPSAWRSAPVDPKATAAFKAALEELNVRPAMSHAMYLINLASPNPNFQKKSREALKAEPEGQYGSSKDLHRDVLSSKQAARRGGSELGQAASAKVQDGWRSQQWNYQWCRQ